MPPVETVGSSREEPAPATGHAPPDPVPGPSQPDTSVPDSQETPEDQPPRAVTLADVQAYIAAADEEERSIIRADLAPDTREGGYQANLKPAWKDLMSFPTQAPPQIFHLHRSPDGSASLEHSAVNIKIHGSLVQD